jgi:hypothetical protein
MLDVFVSRPTWVAEEFRRGLDVFLDVLRKMDLNPRTIGTTDFPTRSPLDEVIHLLDECQGAVILGYPQIRVDAGQIKGDAVKGPLLLPTEWNHIEAGLAYARGLPLLVFHQQGVARGIFDRGALSAFLYSLNLVRPDWCFDAEVSGALETWKHGVVEPRKEARDRAAREASAVPSKPTRVPLSEQLVRVLGVLAGPGQERLATMEIAKILDVAEQKARYYVDELIELNLIQRHMFINRPSEYQLSRGGRAALVERGLL